VHGHHPYRWRTRLRRHLPWWLINLGVADKGEDCEAVGGQHHWYNIDGSSSGCYHCKVIPGPSLDRSDAARQQLT
jgi:hypothetical protein